MKYIEALSEYNGGGTSLFLGGGISNCPDWQKIVVEGLSNTDLVLLNPRRDNFPINDLSASRKQIEWEFRHLETSSAILFWFPSETLCPITLYELGSWSRSQKKLFIGTHPGYLRKQDVLIQTSLIRPEIELANSLDNLVGQVNDWLN